MTKPNTLAYSLERETLAEQVVLDVMLRRSEWRVDIGRLAREARKAKGISIREMAAHCGVSAGFLHDFEHGRRWSITLAHELARVLK